MTTVANLVFASGARTRVRAASFPADATRPIRGRVGLARWILFLGLSLISPLSPAEVSLVLHEQTFGDCIVSISYHAPADGHGSLSVKASTDRHTDCAIDQNQITASLEESLKSFTAKAGLAEIKSLFLGRLAVQFPWISQHLVEKSSRDPGWLKKTEASKLATGNTYVSSSLQAKEVLAPMTTVLRKYGYDLVGAACEKVLLNEKKLPYDAMCWLTVR